MGHDGERASVGSGGCRELRGCRRKSARSARAGAPNRSESPSDRVRRRPVGSSTTYMSPPQAPGRRSGKDTSGRALVAVEEAERQAEEVALLGRPGPRGAEPSSPGTQLPALHLTTSPHRRHGGKKTTVSCSSRGAKLRLNDTISRHKTKTPTRPIVAPSTGRLFFFFLG